MKSITQTIHESMRSDLVFVIIKPGFVEKKEEIIHDLVKMGLVVTKTKQRFLPIKRAQEIYEQHKDKPFYKDLCEYMVSDWTYGLILSNPFHKDIDEIKDQIRKKYGIDEMRNAIHSSDSIENMKRESALYFKN